jgi:hypothetical protein
MLTRRKRDPLPQKTELTAFSAKAKGLIALLGCELRLSPRPLRRSAELSRARFFYTGKE